MSWPLKFLSATRLVPAGRWVLSRLRRGKPHPPVGSVRFGSFRRLSPLSRQFGYDRGQPVDRYYIERFLADHSSDIRGRVLEIADRSYTRMFGGDRVTRSDVLHARDHDEEVTIVGDLSVGDTIPAAAFDCVIVTQTLQVIYDVPAAIATLHRILKPGGVVLATVPGISPISRYDMDRWGYYWSFTTASAERLFAAAFSAQNVMVQAHGNVLASAAFLYGLASQELRREELDHHDPDYQLLIAVRAEKPPVTAAEPS
jgi:SAM-dependent methyltransferase